MADLLHALAKSFMLQVDQRWNQQALRKECQSRSRQDRVVDPDGANRTAGVSLTASRIASQLQDLARRLDREAQFDVRGGELFALDGKNAVWADDRQLTPIRRRRGLGGQSINRTVLKSRPEPAVSAGFAPSTGIYQLG